MRKHDRELRRMAAAHGFKPLRPTRKSHPRFERDGFVVVASATPSDHRAGLNFKQFLKRLDRRKST